MPLINGKMTDKIKKIKVGNKEIIVIDYSDCNERQIIEILADVRKLIREENKPQRVLAIFNSNSFLTTNVMQAFNSDRLDSSLLERQAAIGVTNAKRWIIKNNNTLHNNTIRVFEYEQDALDFLSGE